MTIEKRYCNKCDSEMDIAPGSKECWDLNVCPKCGNRTVGKHQEPYYNYGDEEPNESDTR